MAKLGDYDRRRLGFARQMRRQATDAERRLWSLLRSRQFDGCKFRRQHLIDRYIVDFCCVKHKLVVELDGGQHSDPQALAYDAQRTRRLGELGFRVIRLWDHQVLKETHVVMDTIYRELTV